MEYRYPKRREIRSQDPDIVEDVSNHYEDEEDEDEDEEDEDEESDDDDEDEDDDDDEDDDSEDEEEEEALPYPGFIPISMKYLDQTTKPRSWCLAMITNPYPFHTTLHYFIP